MCPRIGKDVSGADQTAHSMAEALDHAEQEIAEVLLAVLAQ